MADVEAPADLCADLDGCGTSGLRTIYCLSVVKHECDGGRFVRLQPA